MPRQSHASKQYGWKIEKTTKRGRKVLRFGRRYGTRGKLIAKSGSASHGGRRRRR